MIPWWAILYVALISTVSLACLRNKGNWWLVLPGIYTWAVIAVSVFSYFERSTAIQLGNMILVLVITLLSADSHSSFS